MEQCAADLTAETGGAVSAIVCDTTSDESVAHLAMSSISLLGRVEILVNCAASPNYAATPETISDVTAERLMEEMNIKVMGYIRCIRALVPHMREKGGGRVINISGLAARQTGSTIGSIRNVSVVAMTKTLAEQLAPDHISLVAVHPGLTRTEWSADVIRAEAARKGISEEEQEKQMARGNLAGRLLASGEVASLVAFLASPRSGAVNGDVIAAAGGIRGSIYY